MPLHDLVRYQDRLTKDRREALRALTCNPKDADVLAARVRVNAAALDQLDLFSDHVLAALEDLVRDYKPPKLTLTKLLADLAITGVPRFTKAVNTVIRDYEFLRDHSHER